MPPDPSAILNFFGILAAMFVAGVFPRTAVAILFWYILGGWWAILLAPFGILGFLVDLRHLIGE
jgi:hypothetical protein